MPQTTLQTATRQISILRVLALALVASAVVGALREDPLSPPNQLPNVLLVSIDTLRSDHLGCYGYDRETSPAIDRLAAEGTLFETVLAPSSWTLPSHVTLLTAMAPRRHGVRQMRQRLGEGATTLAEVLSDAGYETAGFVAGPFLSAAHGLGQGFDLYDETTIAPGGRLGSHRGVTSPALTRLVLEWLRDWRSSGRTRPFFVFLHMWDPHYDFTPPPPYDELFDPDYRGTVSGADFELGTEVHADMDHRDLEHVVALYDGEIRYTDDHLDLILDALRRRGEIDRTVVVVTSDHGEEFFEHGHKGHAKTLFDESLRVPLVVRYPPKVEAGRRVRDVVRLADVAPTVLGLAGVPMPPEFGSGMSYVDRERDLSPWIDGTRPANEFPHLLAYGDHALYPVKSSIRSTDRKLLMTRGVTHIFDLQTDPGELQDLAIEGLDGTSRRLQRRAKRRAQRMRKAEQFMSPIVLAPSQEDRLRALGYLR